MFGMLKVFVVTFCIFIVIDLLWLGVIAKGIYRAEIGALMRESVNWPAAIIFYLVFVGGLVYFVVNPALISESWIKALTNGLIFGFVTYVTYDLTNLATLKDWTLKIVVIDVAWGTLLGGAVSIISYLLLILIKR